MQGTSVQTSFKKNYIFWISLQRGAFPQIDLLYILSFGLNID